MAQPRIALEDRETEYPTLRRPALRCSSCLNARAGAQAPARARARCCFRPRLSHNEVLERVQMLRLVGVHYVQDVLNLEPGDRWERRLELGVRRVRSVPAVLVERSQGVQVGPPGGQPRATAPRRRPRSSGDQAGDDRGTAGRRAVGGAGTPPLQRPADLLPQTLTQWKRERAGLRAPPAETARRVRSWRRRRWGLTTGRERID